MAQHDVERAPIERQHRVEAGLDDAVDAAVLVRLARCMKREHSIGASVSDTSAETAIEAVTVKANSRNRRPMMPPMSSSGMNTAISETLIDSTVKPISREPLIAASNGGVAVLDVAVDILDHDDGIVDHEADRDGQRHQREVVEAEVEQVHGRARAEQRQRHGDARDQGRPEIAQEQEDDHHHQARW